MPLHDQQIRALLVACRETHPEEIDCEEFLDHLAEYAEARADGRAPPDKLSRVVAHERLCANCAEECSALIDLLQARPDQGDLPMA
jgi:hypothetical protein